MLLLLDVALPGSDVPPLLWLGATVAVLGIVAGSTLSARRIWSVRVDSGGLSVGRDRILFADIDAGHLREVDSGVDAGAPVLGGGWSLPRGRTGLPLRLADGRTVLVPTGGGPPPHIHHTEDETIYVLEGEVTFRLGEVTVVGGPGDFVNVPRGTVHCFRNDGNEPARIVLTFTPAGIGRQEILQKQP